MSFRSRRLARKAGLPPATHTFTIDETLRVTLSDGVVLRAARWIPDGEAHAPLVIYRTPYGRRVQPGEAMLLAERGYQVLVVSCRGTFGSGGTFTPFEDEWRDGHETLTWIEQQPWFPGRAVMAGGSYVGMTQWAVAAKPPAWLRAHCMAVTTSEVRDGVIYPDGVFGLDTCTTWLFGIEHQEEPELRKLWRILVQSHGRLKKADAVLPLSHADTSLAGHRIAHFQTWLDNEPQDSRWWHSLEGFGEDLSGMRPVAMTAGWQDLFLNAQLRDFARLTEAGVPVRIEIGPWTHMSPGLAHSTIKTWYDFLEEVLRPVAGPQLRTVAPIRAHVVLELEAWPPQSFQWRWFPTADGVLASSECVAGEAVYTYDPADPTPAAGGKTLNLFRAGTRNQRRRERRKDVLTWTSEPLAVDTVVAGNGAVELSIASTNGHVDYVVVVADVDERGRSVNVTESVVRLTPDAVTRDVTGRLKLRLALSPTAYCFSAGHRVRLQVSSGAHPIVPRNTGSGEPLVSARRLLPSHHTVFLGGDTLLELPVLDRSAL